MKEAKQDVRFLYLLKETIEQKKGARNTCDLAIKSARNPKVRYVLERLRVAERSHLRTLEMLCASLEEALRQDVAA